MGKSFLSAGLVPFGKHMFSDMSPHERETG
jgi:hypothetical protein